MREKTQIKARRHKAQGFLVCFMIFCMVGLYTSHCQAQVSEHEYKLIMDGVKRFACVEVMCNSCVTWSWKDIDDKTFQRLPCRWKTADPAPDTIPANSFAGFEEDETGIIKIPAAAFTENIPSATHRWELLDNVLMASLPESGVSLGVETIDAPKLSYKIKVVEAGIYYLWIRGEGPDASSDSVNYGIDGERAGTITFLNRPWSNFTQYTATKATLDLTAGIHDLNIWMREDNTRIVLIELTKDADHVPTDADITAGYVP